MRECCGNCNNSSFCTTETKLWCEVKEILVDTKDLCDEWEPSKEKD